MSLYTITMHFNRPAGMPLPQLAESLQRLYDEGGMDGEFKVISEDEPGWYIVRFLRDSDNDWDYAKERCPDMNRGLKEQFLAELEEAFQTLKEEGNYKFGIGPIWNEGAIYNEFPESAPEGAIPVAPTMTTPFVRASCGCIVIPLGIPGKVADTMECILVKACDQDPHDSRDWSFHFRGMGTYKVVDDPNYKRYNESTRRPRPLSDEETRTIVQAIGSLVGMGYRGREIHSALHWIGEDAKRIPSLNAPPPTVPVSDVDDYASH